MPKEEKEVNACCQGCSCAGHGKKFVVLFLMVLFTAIIASGVFFYLTKSESKQNIYVSSAIEKSKIDVSGTAKTTVTPDQAETSIGVEVQENTAKEAQAKNAEIMDKVKKALKDNGIKDGDIKTTYFYTQAVTESYWVCPVGLLNCTEDDEIWKTKIVGYKTTHILEVKTDQLSKVGDVLDAVVGAGANDINDVSFTLKEETLKQIKQQLLTQAVVDAKSQAERIANASGVKLLKPLEISESYSYYPIEYRAYESEALSAMSDYYAPTSVSSGTVDVSVSVSATYEME